MFGGLTLSFFACYNRTAMLRQSAPILLCLFCLAILPVGAMAQSDGILSVKGPLPYRDREPLNAPFLLPQPTAAGTLQRGKARLDARFEIVNNLLTDRDNKEHLYVTDFEEQRLMLDYARGLGRRQEVGAQVTLIARNSGVLDTFINNWHSIFGFAGGGRNDLPDYRNLFTVRNADTRTVIDTQKNTAGFGDTVLEYRYDLTELAPEVEKTRTVAATARALVKLPTGNTGSLFGSGAFDAGIGLAITGRPNRRWAVHGNATLVLLGKPENKELNAKRTQVHSLLSVEYLLNGRTSLVVQTDNNPSPFRSGLAYPDRPRRSFTLGAWRQISGTNRIYALISENDFGPLAKHAPDFVFSTGVRLGM